MRGGAYTRAAFRYAKARNEHCSSWAKNFNRNFASGGAFYVNGSMPNFAGGGAASFFAMGEPMPVTGFAEQHTVGNSLTCNGMTELTTSADPAESELAAAVADALSSMLNHGSVTWSPVCCVNNGICETSMGFTTGLRSLFSIALEYCLKDTAEPGHWVGKMQA
ncbi:unnamed protein product [Amoebophrya sp. A120]|nr:unnamed protein product [Amoebophrya sp. A120]|eukprot:GSA120T00007096001.1